MPRNLTEVALRDAPVVIDDELLKQWSLPDPHQASDKDERGRILIIGGSSQMPGAIILAATAAMRAGAGKLCIATGASVAQLVAQSMPEARVIGLDESGRGGLQATSADRIDFEADCILIGPGMQDEEASVALCGAIMKKFPMTPTVLDALAMSVVVSRMWQETPTGDVVTQTSTLQHIPSRATMITPHAGEMAHLMKVEKEQIEHDPRRAAISAAQRWKTTVALKGAETFVASPSGMQWNHRGGNVGLATSGSGDVLAGIITGLCARGATAEQAMAWAVRVHACAGDALEERCGPVGFLARELPAEIPRILRRLG